jgi:hypothetical protein
MYDLDPDLDPHGTAFIFKTIPMKHWTQGKSSMLGFQKYCILKG